MARNAVYVKHLLKGVGMSVPKTKRTRHVDLCKVRQGCNNNNMPNPYPDVSSFGLLLVHPCLTLLHLLFA